MSITDLVNHSYLTSESKGFHENPEHENVGEKLMLITSELGEALEADRKGKKANLADFEERLALLNSSHNTSAYGPITPEIEEENFRKIFRIYIKDSFEDEIADATIRVGDLCGWKKIDLDKFVSLKMRYNRGREYKHGKAY